MLIVALTQTKGGSGKSTLAQSVAVEAARDGNQVLLVDLDPAQSAAKWWRRRGGPSNPMLDVDVRSFLTLVDATESRGTDVLVIDTPGELMDRIRIAIANAHVIVVPVAPSIKDWEAMDAVEGIIAKAGKQRQTLYVINRYRASTDASVEMKKALITRTGAVPLTVALATDHEKADAQGKSGAEINNKIAGEIGMLWEAIKKAGENHDQQAIHVPAAG